MNIYMIAILLLVVAVAMLIYLYRSRAMLITGAADYIKDIKKAPRTKSEAEVIRHFEEITKREFPTIVPEWLLWKGKRLELDGYSKDIAIAVEFSGPLHTKWFPAKESYKQYFTRIVRDVVKKKICALKGVNLIVIDMTLPKQHYRDYILSRLFDIGFLADKPCNYINAQTAEPYRNPHLEAELGLGRELQDAVAITN